MSRKSPTTTTDSRAGYWNRAVSTDESGTRWRRPSRRGSTTSWRGARGRPKRRRRTCVRQEARPRWLLQAPRPRPKSSGTRLMTCSFMVLTSDNVRAMAAPVRDERADALRARYHAAFGDAELPVPVKAIAEDLLGLLVGERND